MAELSMNAETAIVVDPAGVAAPIAFVSDSASPELKAYAEDQAKEMDALARIIEGLMNEPGINDAERGDLAALKNTVINAAANLRTGGVSLISVGAMSAAAAQAYAAAKNIDNASDEQQREEAGADGTNIPVSASAAAAANDNFFNFSRAHAQRLQQLMAKGNEQGAVALDVMKSQASQLAWDNREEAARLAGYEKDSPEYLQYMMQTETFALLTARGEQRENIYRELAAKQGLQERTAEYDQFMVEHRAMDREQDDASYARHYNTAKKKLFDQYPGAKEELERLEKDPKNEGKAFLLALKEDANLARNEVAKYGHELNREELAKLSHEDRAKYLAARVTLSTHESLYVEGEGLKDVFLNYEKQRLSIDEKKDLSREQRLALKEQAFDRTIKETQRILGRELSAEELNGLLDQTKERGDDLSKTTGSVIRGSSESVNDIQPTRERKAENPNPKFDAILAQMQEHRELLVDRGILSAAYAPEHKPMLSAQEQTIAGLSASTDILAGIRQQFLAGGHSFNAANDYQDPIGLPSLDFKAAGFEKPAAITHKFS